MLYTTVQDIPGRLRLRCGRGLLSAEQAAGISEGLLALPGVQHAKVAPANGSILVEYQPGNMQAHDAVIAFVDALDSLALPKASPNAHENDIVEDSTFMARLAGMALRRLTMRFLLPPSIRSAFAIINTVSLVVNALRIVAQRRLTVEVLDATAVTVSLLQRNYASAASIMFLLRLSDTLQHHVNARTRIALQESLFTHAETVWLVSKDGVDVEVQMDELTVGDRIRVRTGQTLPVDGTVVEGDASVNEASMTGEAASVHKRCDSTVYAGTVCEDGNIVVRVDALAGSSRIDQIVRLVEESAECKASIQAHAEKLADKLVPGSLFAFLTTLALTRDLYKASSVLMVDFSCAIKLSMPVAVMSAMREASARGAVVKGGKYLEALAKADVVVFDKTGTLTTATPKVERVIAVDGMSEDEALTLAACLEEHFPHSLARSIVQAAKDAGLHHEEENHSEVEYVVAHGIASSVGKKKVYLGSAHFIFNDEGIPYPEGLFERLEEEVPRASTVFLAVDGKLEAVICISDPLREEAKQVLAQLRLLGVDHMVMLTGDSEICAKSVAEELGINDYRAQVLPEDKFRFVEDLKAAGHTVAMVGDGINDSPALAAADVSIALNDASDIARAVADVSVLGSSLEALVMLRQLSKRMLGRIHRDYRFIVGFNGSLIAAGIVGVLPPTTAAYLHNASTVAVTAANTRPLLSDKSE